MNASPIKVGQRVITPNGLGVVSDIEFYNRLNSGTYRYGVTLDHNAFSFPVAYFFDDEVSVASNDC